MTPDAFWFDARAAAAVLMLTIGAVMDLRSRRVPNPYWIPWLAVAALFPVWEWASTGALPSPAAYVAAAVCVVVFYFLWHFGILFGGADAKALMVVAMLVPTLPGQTMTTFAIDTLTWGAIASLAWPVSLFIGNAARGRFRGALPWLAWPMRLDDARRRHVWPLQRVEDGVVVTRTKPHRDEDLDAVYASLADAAVDPVWAGPKIPFLVPLAAGAALAWATGNPLLHLMQWLL